jgi:hypothetical protein
MSTHLNVFLGIFEVFEQRVVTPGDPGLFVGSGIGVAISLSRLTTKKPVKVGSLLVGSTLFHSVALRALGLEDLGSFFFVSVASHGCKLLFVVLVTDYVEYKIPCYFFGDVGE